LTAGKIGNDPIFTGRDGRVWKKSHQLPTDARSLPKGEDQASDFISCPSAPHVSTLAVRGVPMGVIAEQLGHADTRMTEKHYVHLAPSYVADTILTPIF
jgi:integrase